MRTMTEMATSRCSPITNARGILVINDRPRPFVHESKQMTLQTTIKPEAN
jgi:hypothetical protein